MDEAARVCARLLAAGTIARRDLVELDHPSIRVEVEARLRGCGLELATSAYSDHVGIRLAEEASDATVLDAATNLGLGADACALLTVLWARLALQQRTAGDTRATPESQPALLPEHRSQAARDYAPSVRFETLVREFGARLGGRTRLRALVGQLRRLGFVRYKLLEAIEPGPMLELGIDGERMVSFIRSRVLGQLLEARGAAVEDAPMGPTLPDRVLAAVVESEEPAGIAVLQRRTGLPRGQLRRALQELRDEGRIEMLGVRAGTQYRLRRQAPGPAPASGTARFDGATTPGAG
jgi:hypothetical protein